MSRQWLFVAAGLGLALVFVGVGWLNREKLVMVEVGSRAPDFEAVDLSGVPARLSDLQGEVVLLNVWATWCPPLQGGDALDAAAA